MEQEKPCKAVVFVFADLFACQASGLPLVGSPVDILKVHYLYF